MKRKDSVKDIGALLDWIGEEPTQGANDPRAPASESDQMLAAVRDNGTEAWYLLARDEGHGFSKKSNQDYMREAVTVFLNDVLR